MPTRSSTHWLIASIYQPCFKGLAVPLVLGCVHLPSLLCLCPTAHSTPQCQASSQPPVTPPPAVYLTHPNPMNLLGPQPPSVPFHPHPLFCLHPLLSTVQLAQSPLLVDSIFPLRNPMSLTHLLYHSQTTLMC